MASVEVTQHLYRYFPALENRPLQVTGSTLAEVINDLDQQVPGIRDYVLDERGSLRRHVNLCINQRLIRDRAQLSDPVAATDTVFIFQALSGG